VGSNDDQCNESCGFFSIPPIWFALLATLIGIVLVDNLDAKEQSSVGNFIMSIAQTLVTTSAQQDVIQQNQQKQIQRQIQSLKNQISALEDSLN